MSSTKHNWEKLKRQFLFSRHKTIKCFLSDNNVTYNSRTRTNTRGWIKEKKVYQQQTTEAVKQKVIEDKQKFASDLMNKTLILLERKVVELLTTKEPVSIRDIKTLWEMVRVECDLYTKVSYSDYQHSQQKNATEKDDQAIIDSLMEMAARY